MPKYFIKWDSGFGENYYVEEHDDEDAARDAAYEAAREEFENSASYSAQLFTKQIAENYGLEDELEEDE